MGALRGFDLQATLLKLESEIARYRGKASEARPAPGAETRFAELSGSFRATKGTFRQRGFRDEGNRRSGWAAAG